MVLQVGDVFPSAEDCRNAIQRHVLDEGESYKVVKSDKKRYIVSCKDNKCTFRIRASNRVKKGFTITILQPYICSPAVHYKNKNSHSVKYLTEHHRVSIIDNRHITATQIRSNERLNYSNEISYQQAYCTIQAVLLEMYSNEADSFAKFLAYAERFKAADPNNYAKIQVHKETGHFLGSSSYSYP
jgi:hypothetical protein